MLEEQYQKGVEQFSRMVGTNKIDELREKFRSLSPDFEKCVTGVVGGEIWSRPTARAKTSSAAPRPYALCDQAPDLVERMDYHEGFHIYGEHGSIVGKTYLPWFLKSSDVECFSTRDGQYHRPLGADAHFYRLQLEGFADAVLHGAPQMGADVEDGTQAMRAMAAIARSVASGDWVRFETVTGGV